jgi:predicted dehydrogenase
VATIPFVYRFYGSVREMRGRAAGGGEVVQLRGSYLQDWLAGRAQQLAGRPRPRRTVPAFGDIGVHWVDLAEFVTGHRIARLTA